MKTVKPNRKGGGSPPTKRTPETLGILIQAVETGAPIRACCAAARISTELLRQWCEEVPDVADQIAEAKERGRMEALRILQEAGHKDWRAAAEWLRFAFRNEYSTRAEIKMEAAEKPSAIVITPEVLEQLQEGHKELLESLNT